MSDNRLVSRNRLRSAFTLVELLVVVGIITVLIAILLPVMGKAREAAQRSTCLSQMRQVGLALMAYSAEHKGFTPVQLNDLPDFASTTNLDANDCNKRSVLGTLLSYMSKERRVLRCPVASEFTWWGTITDANPNSDTNYMTNAAVVGKNLTRIRKSSDIVLFQEDRFRWEYAWMRPCPWTPVNGKRTYTAWAFPNSAPWGQEYTVHHNKGGNLVFCDGHGEWRRSSDMRPADFSFTGGTGVTGTANDTSDMPVHGLTYFSALD
jgi:prepilin-type N-terminal cleavage/methylation domain-containing protein/prepilin-type processing-associated H-X9-DG protein